MIRPSTSADAACRPSLQENISRSDLCILCNIDVPRSSGWVTQAAILAALPPNQNGYLVFLPFSHASVLGRVVLSRKITLPEALSGTFMLTVSEFDLRKRERRHGTRRSKSPGRRIFGPARLSLNVLSARQSLTSSCDTSRASKNARVLHLLSSDSPRLTPASRAGSCE